MCLVTEPTHPEQCVWLRVRVPATPATLLWPLVLALLAQATLRFVPAAPARQLAAPCPWRRAQPHRTALAPWLCRAVTVKALATLLFWLVWRVPALLAKPLCLVARLVACRTVATPGCKAVPALLLQVALSLLLAASALTTAGTSRSLAAREVHAQVTSVCRLRLLPTIAPAPVW